MQRTISVMVGKGSLRHNSRQFHAANTDPGRSYRNIEYCNEDIRSVYHELFDDALARYNAKQTRADRHIDDYYEKIRGGRQEKLFHEIILQIGNKDDMSALDENGALAAEILDEYMRGFQERNPNLRVFSAHLHMDEATPHLHIDFVPFTTGSKRGLDTRVSLKRALGAQGFTGGTRRETEWSQWVQSEKEHLASIMLEHGIEWHHNDTHEKHLSVLDYEKKMRAEEVAELTEQAAEKQSEIERLEAQKTAAQEKLSRIAPRLKDVEATAVKYCYGDKEILPEASALETGRSYREKKALPAMKKIQKAFLAVYNAYLQIKEKFTRLKASYDRAVENIGALQHRLTEVLEENKTLQRTAGKYNILCRFYGKDRIEAMTAAAEQARKEKIAEHGKRREAR